MKYLLVIASILLAVLSWGLYGPTLHEGQTVMQTEVEAASGVTPRLRPFMCVGLAYFVIAVVVPTLVLQAYGEKGHWTTAGVIWSVLAGAAGAIGALGIIAAFGAGGSPIFVMPLVFGGAPVVNSFLTIFWAKTYKQVGPVFLAGLVLVVLGAVTVLLFNPSAAGATNFGAMTWTDRLMVLGSVLLVIASWGIYGPVLHKGQMKMEGSRLRPLICVGVAYFAIAVIVPSILLVGGAEPDGGFNFSGSVWSLLAGTAGALGALGIILSFTFGGKPVYVMPLVFGGAPVVNTFTTMIQRGDYSDVSPLFLAGLIVVAAGAVMVLVFAPKTVPQVPAKSKKQLKKEAQAAAALEKKEAEKKAAEKRAAERNETESK